METKNLNNNMIVKKILKDGTEKIYEYDQKEYNKKYYAKHKEKLNKSIECPVCKGTYCIMSKAKHMKSARHCKFIEKPKEETKEETKEEETEEEEAKKQFIQTNYESILANKRTYI